MNVFQYFEYFMCVGSNFTTLLRRQDHVHRVQKLSDI